MNFKITFMIAVILSLVFTAHSSSQSPAAGTVEANESAPFRYPLDTPAKQSALAAEGMFNGIASAGRRVIAVGERGHIVYSDDKGKTWSQSRVPVSVCLTAVYFPTPEQGWAVGHGGVVLHSSDSGQTWTKQMDGFDACEIMKDYYTKNPPVVTGDESATIRLRNEIEFMVGRGGVYPFLDVWFENESTGFIIGAFNLIFHTTDGGKNWKPWLECTDNPMSLHLYSIRPAGGNLYIAGEQGLVLKLNREKGFFEEKKTPYIGTYFGIMGIKDSLITYGMRGNVYRSSDGGESWQKVETEVAAGILGGNVADDGTVMLVSQAGQVLVSADAGKSFSLVKRDNGAGIPLHAITAVDADTLVLAAGWTGLQVEKLQ